ncbi:site-2 protease family protein [Thermococcus sp.]|uniref:site-2 protease family protein n=1 Tax=Thermococcus sp. TaxID=35749 RepID=UPI002639285B|nr:site-2 protease family protein [Thermococcus sp.]
MVRGIYECINCGHREEVDSNEPLLEGACPKCGGDMVLVGYARNGEKVPVQPLELPVPAGPPVLPREVAETIKRFYNAELIKTDGSVFVYEVHEIFERNFEMILGELEKTGYWAALKRREGKTLLFVFPAQAPKKDNLWLPIAFLLATIATTLLAGYYLAVNYIALLDEYGLPGIRNPWLDAIAFSVSLMAILGTHEMGHKVAAAYHNVRSTFPYFIPFPNFLGTLGAIIRVKSPLPTRNAAIDLGVSGPIAGFLVAIPVSVIGLRLSAVVPGVSMPATSKSILFGENLFFILLEKYIVNFPQNGTVFLHPVAIAGWVGILVTFLNLVPAAQLDGGHIARAFLGEKAHYYFTLALGLGMLAMSYLWVGWALWGILVLMMGAMGNPGALDEASPISRRRVVLALIAVIIFVLSATPRPFWVTG